MRIALIGYGKMGKAIEQIASRENHSIVYKIDHGDSLDQIEADQVDIAIEFTQPDSAFRNLEFCLTKGIPVISGTTGWLEKKPQIEELCAQNEGTFLYASNYSIGVNLFFEMNEWLAAKMKSLSFSSQLKEIHHTEKKLCPVFDDRLFSRLSSPFFLNA